ncbi:MAG: stalk domain-containing protein [Bacillota bacterium]
MKRLAVWLLALLVAALLPPFAQAKELTTRVVVDGIPLKSDVPPMLINGRTLVPFRAIAEALGVRVQWVPESRTILAGGQGRSLELVVGDRRAVVNGVAVELDVEPQLVENRTLVPVRIFAEAFQATVLWDEESRTVSIRSAVRPMRTLVFYGLGSYQWRGFLRHFSDVAFTWSSITPEGELSLDQGEYFWPEGADEVLGLARDEDVNRFLAVVRGDRDGGLTDLVLDTAAHDRLAAQIEAVVLEQRLEGVVLDLEGLGLGAGDEELTRIRSGYVGLVKAVADRLHRWGREVVVAVPPPPPNGWYPGYDHAAVAVHADLVLVMAYHYAGHEPEPLEKVEEAILLSLREVPREKLLLGILMEYETRESVVQKVALAKRHNLAGISVWIITSLDGEEMQAIDSLVTPLR